MIDVKLLLHLLITLMVYLYGNNCAQGLHFSAFISIEIGDYKNLAHAELNLLTGICSCRVLHGKRSHNSYKVFLQTLLIFSNKV